MDKNQLANSRSNFGQSVSWTSNREKLGGITLIEHLFKRLDEIFLGRFMASFGGEEHLAEGMATWVELLTADRITLAEVKKGLDACKRLKFPPCYGEFYSCCRDEVDYMMAFNEAVAGLSAMRGGFDFNWSDRAVYWAAIDFGQFDIMRKTYKESEKRWEKLLKKRMLDEHLKPIPEPVKAITFNRATRDKAKAASAIGHMKELLSSAKKESIAC